MHTRFAPRRTPTLAAIVLVAATLAASTAAAQQPPEPGTRVTYYSSSATVQGATRALVPNPNAVNGYVDPTTGQTFSNADISGSAAGEGYLQVDVLYVDEQVCAGVVTNYTYDRSVGLLLQSSQNGFVTEAGRCHDAWIAPATLLRAPVGVTPQQTVVRGVENMGGRNVEILLTSVATSTGANRTVHDLATGYLISATTSSISTVATVPPGGGAVTQAAGRTLLTSNQFLDVRRLPTPMSNAPLPQHVRAMRSLHYDCVSGSTGGMITTQDPCSQRLDVVGASAGLLRARVTMQLASVPGMSFDEDWIISSAPNVGNVYMPREYLRSLTPGHVLDQDPITGVRTVVLHADAQVVVLARQNTYESIRTTYDLASGWLLESVKEQQLGDAIYFLHFALNRVE